MRRNVLSVSILMLAFGAGAQAQTPTPAQTPAPMAMPMPAPGQTGTQTGAPARLDNEAMMTAMDRMSHDMAAAKMTGDPDQDLVAMMIPHHQGAIEMAQIYLRSGRDPHIRRIATKIIRDQEREIREMRAWQAKQPAR